MKEEKIPDEALLAGEEALLGGPAKISPAEGLRLMRERQENLVKYLETCNSESEIKQITKELQDTRLRIAEYQSQIGSSN